MSRARNLADLLQGNTTVPKSKLGALDIVNSDVASNAGIVATKLGTMAPANVPVGSVIQTVSLTKSTGLEVQTHNTWTSLYSDANCLKITPSATANKVFIQYLLGYCESCVLIHT